MPTISRAQWKEGTAVLLWTLIGGLLRATRFPSLGLNHFDEGIYAMTGAWIVSPPRNGPWIDPQTIAYAPPGFPSLVAAAYMVFGVSGKAAILVSWLAGTATIPVVGWIARRWIGPGAGVAAAAMAAFCGPHVVFSRMALTDTTALLTWLVAMAAGAAMLERSTPFGSMRFGLAVGIAQLVKYSGWIAGIVVGASAILGCLGRDPARRKSEVRRLLFVAMAAPIAGLVYWPWYRFVETHGGYSALMAHHQTYVDGPDAWGRNWISQQAQTIALSGRIALLGSWSSVGWILAVVGTAWVLKRSDRRWTIEWSGRGALLLLGGALILAVAPESPWWLGLLLLPQAFTTTRTDVRVLTVWWLILSIMTPLYHPYARLWLPLHAVGWILTARLILTLLKPTEEAFSAPTEGRPPHLTRARVGWVGLVAIAAIMTHLLFLRGATPLPRLLGPTNGLQQTAKQVANEIERSPPGIQSGSIDALGRPPLLFYLVESGVVVGRLADVNAAEESLVRGRPLLVDEAQAISWRPPVEVKVAAWDPLAPATLLDLDPGAAFGRTRLGTSDGSARSWNRSSSPQEMPEVRVWFSNTNQK